MDRCLEAENTLIKMTEMIMRSELNVVMTTSNNLKMTNISVAISSGLSLKEAVLACKTFTDTVGSC